jgi:hypothetical protein
MLLSCRGSNKPMLQLCCLGRARPVSVRTAEDINCIPPELRDVSPYAESVLSAGSAINFMLSQSKLSGSNVVSSWHRADTPRKFDQPAHKIQAMMTLESSR